MSRPFLKRDHNPLAVGDILRSTGDGAKLVQVFSRTGVALKLVSAGKAKGGAHTPPRAPRMFDAVELPRGVAESTSGATYVKVVPRRKLKGLVI